MRKVLVAAVAALTMVGTTAVAAGAATTAKPVDAARAEHDRIVRFWTNARVAKAVPRDMVLDPSSGKVKPMAKPAPTTTTTATTTGTSVLGASWTGGGAVANTTGKVLFALGTSYYVCSASVINDTVSGRSLILTAGHCAYDESKKVFATNWMFIPNYDAKPASLTTSGSFCANTLYGCWTASALVVRNEFATAGGFNLQAQLNDFAIAVVGAGGKSGTAQLDATVGSQAVNFNTVANGADTWLFGYPAAQKYKGNDLVYSRGTLGTDPNTSNQTYRVASDMTGGCSGGPWFSPFTSSNGTGTIMSVNSYGYQGQSALYGPRLNSRTQAEYDAALTATANTLVSG